jgi:hypothetical protein
MVVTEEGPHNVLAYDFSGEREARRFFEEYPCSRILFDAAGQELNCGGWPNPFDTIRRQIADRRMHA